MHLAGEIARKGLHLWRTSWVFNLPKASNQLKTLTFVGAQDFQIKEEEKKVVDPSDEISFLKRDLQENNSDPSNFQILLSAT